MSWSSGFSLLGRTAALKAELHARTKDLVVFGWEFTLEPVLRPCRLKPELHT